MTGLQQLCASLYKLLRKEVKIPFAYQISELSEVTWKRFLALSFVGPLLQVSVRPYLAFAKGENYIIVSTVDIASLFYGVELGKAS